MIRIFTFRINDCIYFTGTALRVGTIGFVDNYSAGGLVLSIEIKTSLVKEEAENCIGKRFKKHPITESEFKEFKISNWNKVIEIVYNMAQEYEWM